MQIKLTDDAVKWFEEEYPLDQGEAIRFFGKTYGKTEVHDGFSVGMSLSSTSGHDILAETKVNGRTYFTSKEDDWFFNPYDLEVDFDLEKEVPLYHFVEHVK